MILLLERLVWSYMRYQWSLSSARFFCRPHLLSSLSSLLSPLSPSFTASHLSLSLSSFISSVTFFHLLLCVCKGADSAEWFKVLHQLNHQLLLSERRELWGQYSEKILLQYLDQILLQYSGKIYYHSTQAKYYCSTLTKYYCSTQTKYWSLNSQSQLISPLLYRTSENWL